MQSTSRDKGLMPKRIAAMAVAMAAGICLLPQTAAAGLLTGAATLAETSDTPQVEKVWYGGHGHYGYGGYGHYYQPYYSGYYNNYPYRYGYYRPYRYY